MKANAIFLCLFLASGGSQDQDRTAWPEKVRTIKPSWSRKELDAFLDTIRVAVAHRPSVLNGGGFGIGNRFTFFDVYSLDQNCALYVVWNTEDSTKGIRSTEVVSFSDLKDRVDPEMFDAMSAIHRSPGAEQGLAFEPILLIRAVNALRPMGKERAIKALRGYCRLARSLTVEERSKYFLDEYRIPPIVRLLFDHPPGGRPDWGLGAPDLYPPPARIWPLYPLASPQDVPFLVVSGFHLTTGRPKDAEDDLRIDLGPLRADPLAPRVTPLEAADELTQSEGWKALRLQPGDEGRKKWQIRRQALRAASPVFALRPEESSNDCCVDPTEAQWRAAVDRAKAAGIVWSPEIQDFILGR
jgi:hypothetical protein